MQEHEVKVFKVGENKNERSSQHTIIVSTNTSNNYSVSGTEGFHDLKKSDKYCQCQHDRTAHLVRTMYPKFSNSLIYTSV